MAADTRCWQSPVQRAEPGHRLSGGQGYTPHDTMKVAGQRSPKATELRPPAKSSWRRCVERSSKQARIQTESGSLLHGARRAASSTCASVCC